MIPNWAALILIILIFVTAAGWQRVWSMKKEYQKLSRALARFTNDELLNVSKLNKTPDLFVEDGDGTYDDFYPPFKEDKEAFFRALNTGHNHYGQLYTKYKKK